MVPHGTLAPQSHGVCVCSRMEIAQTRVSDGFSFDHHSPSLHQAAIKRVFDGCARPQKQDPPNLWPICGFIQQIFVAPSLFGLRPICTSRGAGAMSCGFTGLVALQGALSHASQWAGELWANAHPTYYGMPLGDDGYGSKCQNQSTKEPQILVLGARKPGFCFGHSFVTLSHVFEHASWVPSRCLSQTNVVRVSIESHHSIDQLLTWGNAVTFPACPG